VIRDSLRLSVEGSLEAVTRKQPRKNGKVSGRRRRKAEGGMGERKEGGSRVELWDSQTVSKETEGEDGSGHEVACSVRGSEDLGESFVVVLWKDGWEEGEKGGGKEKEISFVLHSVSSSLLFYISMSFEIARR